MTRGWDKGIDYETAKKKIERFINKTRSNSKSRCYAYILYLQLYNGSRISEAIRAAYMFSKNPERREVEVELSKNKTRRTRLMVKPKELVDIAKCEKVYSELMKMDAKRASDRLAFFAKIRLGFNTHSLRYAFITNLLLKSVEPTLIAKIVGHRKLEHILTYTQETKARELLRKLVS